MRDKENNDGTERGGVESAPSLDDLMKDLEQKGLEKYASRVKEVAAALPPLWSPPARKPRGRGAPPRRGPREVPYGSPMLQRGEPYTEVDPRSGEEDQRTYTPAPRGVLVSDFLRKQLDDETDPAKKKYLSELIEQASRAEKAAWSKKADEKKHWLSEQNDHKFPPKKPDPVVSFLKAELTRVPDYRAKMVVKELLDRRQSQGGGQEGQRRAASEAMLKCASGLREKGYEALASRLESKVAAVYKLGDGVRIKGLPEYIEGSKATMTDTKNLFDEMYDKYIRVFEGVASILKMAKREMRDPSDIEEALKEVLKPNQLMMQKLLEVGELIKGGQR